MDAIRRNSQESIQAEIAEILAAGLVRLRARKSRGISADGGESSLDFVSAQSGDPDEMSPEPVP